MSKTQSIISLARETNSDMMKIKYRTHNAKSVLKSEELSTEEKLNILAEMMSEIDQIVKEYE